MEKRFIMPTIISILLLSIATFLTFLPVMHGATGDIIPIIPGGVLVDVIMGTVIPLVSMLLMLLLGPIMAIFLIKIHKLMKLNKYDYFIIKSEKKLPGSRILARSVLPGLLAINVAIYINLSSNMSGLFYSGTGGIGAAIEYTAVVIGIPIACLVVLPLWMLESSGLMCSKQVDSYNRPVSHDIESVGQFYTKLIKGYVGISTVLSYVLILYQIYNSDSVASVYLLVFIDPIVIIMLFLFISLLIEMRADKLNAKLMTSYEKLGIKTAPKTIKIE